VDTEAALEAASAAYGEAEHTYIEALAAGADDQALQGLLARVVETANAWEIAEHETPPLPEGLTRYYDLPEVVATLWRDLADAHKQRVDRKT
jgi:hypothetical protein